MAEQVAIDVTDHRQSTSATPDPHDSAVLVRFRVTALRSDGAAKAWSGEALLKRDGGTVTVAEVIPTPVDVFASAWHHHRGPGRADHRVEFLFIQGFGTSL